MPRTTIGLERFLALRARRGLRYGLVTNQAAVAPDGRPAWRAFADAGLGPARLFGPEHGFLGAAADAAPVPDGRFRGIPVRSLYGESAKPTPESLDGLDALVFDLQDVGCRYYTYLYTLAYAMEACAEAGLPLIVLDRPNPTGGLAVEGGPIAPEASSFVGGYGLPHRHGMTVGEFALYLRGEYYPGAPVEVVGLEGWERRSLWDDTGLPWSPPSPAMPTPAAALAYSGTCLLEGTNLSEGRGTARPFDLVGAPWVDGERLREELAALGLPGVVFSSLYFRPSSSKYAGEDCGGALLSVVDPRAFRSLDCGVAVVRAAKALWPGEFEWKRDWEGLAPSFFDRLAGGPALREAVDRLAPLDECLAIACAGRDAFMARREPYLLY